MSMAPCTRSCEPSRNGSAIEQSKLTGLAHLGRAGGSAIFSATSALARLNQARLVGEHDGLDAVAQAQLHQHACDVRLDRRLREKQLLCDLPVRPAARYQTQNGELALGQLGGRAGGSV